MLDPQSVNSGIANDPPQENASSNQLQVPKITLPQGGGAIKGIDQKFKVNPSNGTASFEIPLPLSPGRHGFIPHLSLSYNSGNGNSAFGLGWNLGLSSIQRNVNKAIPAYQENDTFVFSEAEELVPFLEQENTSNNWKPKQTQSGDYTVKRYCPRIEGSFARIEKITHAQHGTYWKVTSRNNLVTIFGRSKQARIADPTDDSRIFKWLPEFSYDDKGNCLQYEYRIDSNYHADGSIYQDSSVPDTLFEKNRKNGRAPFSNTYLKSIKYGNQKAHYPNPALPYDPPLPTPAQYFFELILDYGEHNDAQMPHLATNLWDYRPDAFSNYSVGFEIRTQRLCRRILMFHHFENESQVLGYDAQGQAIETGFGKNYLVKSLNLTYQPASLSDHTNSVEFQYLSTISQSGYIKKANGDYASKTLPPVEFGYQKMTWNQPVKKLPQESTSQIPEGLSRNYQWVDLFNEGIAGILTEQAEGWFYKSNLGNFNDTQTLMFGPVQEVMSKPSLKGLSIGQLSLQDLEANGRKQLVVNQGNLKGYFEMNSGETWQNFVPFEQIANIDWNDANTRLIDLNGDGQPELLITEEQAFVWYASQGKKGYDAAQIAHKSLDEELGPAIIFADVLQRIYLADMTGDGLSDIVRIRNGEVCYWANKGYGAFSAKVTMANAPLFDHEESFNPQYLHLADINGTGATDLIYLGKNSGQVSINLSGNAWSDVQEIVPFFDLHNAGRLSVVDVSGTGTSSLVWSSDIPGDDHLYYIDLMGGKKPHLLTHYKNNLGQETTLEYTASTYFYLQDKQAGQPWITRLPFPVQVISKVVSQDKVSNVRFTSEYTYHHGYYDHQEKEFRGFGRVEQLDTETITDWQRNNATTALESDSAFYQPPILTKTWFHTGAFLAKEAILEQFKSEYWYKAYNQQFASTEAQVTEPGLPEAQLTEEIQNLPVEAYQEALRACKGMVLRQEVFTRDVQENPLAKVFKQQMIPFTVSTHNCFIQQLQPRQGEAYGVFLNTESEALSIQYEGRIDDPRVSHTIHTKIDELGQVLESASVVYGREPLKARNEFQALSQQITDFSQEALGQDALSKAQMQTAFEVNLHAAEQAQTQTQVLVSAQTFAQYQATQGLVNDIDLPHVYLLRLPYESQTYQITGLNATSSKALFQKETLANALQVATEIAYHEKPDVSLGIQKRLIESSKVKYQKDELTPLPFGRYDTLGLLYESYQLAYTPALIQQIYQKEEGTPLQAKGQTAQALFTQEGDYTLIDQNFWIRSGLVHLRDQAQETLTEVKARFFSPIAYEDALGTRTRVTYDVETFAGPEENTPQRNNDGYYLFQRSTEDALGGKPQVARFDYRTLSPIRNIDSNANPSSVLLDELGMVKAIALEGNGTFSNTDRTQVELLEAADSLAGLMAYENPTEIVLMQQFWAAATTQSTHTTQLRQASQQLIQQATSRFVYDYNSYLHHQKPTALASIIREEHHAINPLSRLQWSFAYANGNGQTLMTKTQAEPGMAYYIEHGARKAKDTGAELRWIGNGRTVLNNKGNPVKQYEPYFSTNFGYEDDSELVEIGVTPLLYYDALGRNIKTEFPDGTLSTAAFDAWKQSSHDANDNALASSWYQQRKQRSIAQELTAEGKNPDKEFEAAQKAASHNKTPQTVYFDSLGRPILALDHNGWDTAQKARLYTTFFELDIEGNLQTMTDARGNQVERYQYNLLGERICVQTSDAGTSWGMSNVLGNPLYQWDSKGQIFSSAYDLLHRPIAQYLHDLAYTTPQMIEKVVYGENHPEVYAQNLWGQAIQTYDSSGLNTLVSLDFKGNPLAVQRQFAATYGVPVIDWSDQSPTHQLETEVFTNLAEYDALNRRTRQYDWHRNAQRVSVYEPTYNERGIVVREDKITAAQKTAQGYTGGQRINFLVDIAYNEKGQRLYIRYGNGTMTRYHYDPENYRLVQMRTTRTSSNSGQLPQAPSNLSDAQVLQNLYYTYDAVGNIIEIEDDAYEPVFFQNQKVDPKCRYTYDALYRLISAEGRENHSFNQAPTANETHPLQVSFPQTDQALRNYTQTYHYDAVGNILQMRHRAQVDRWTHRYAYAEDSNRLLQTWLGNHTLQAIHYQYDTHGNLLNYQQIPEEYRPEWDYDDRVSAINLAGGGMVYYQYDSGKQRSRKRIERSNHTIEERLYLGGMEVYRRWQAGQLVEEIETHHVLSNGERMLMVENVLQTNNSNLATGILQRYQYTNHLGSVGLEADEQAQIISYEEYHPYGTVAYQAVNATLKMTAKRYRYTGMERDEESGLNYHSARYYLPWLARWLSADPIGVEGGLNVYEYGNSSPITFSDTGGFDPEDEIKPDSFLEKIRGKLSPRTRKAAKIAESLSDLLNDGKMDDTRHKPNDHQVVKEDGNALRQGEKTPGANGDTPPAPNPHEEIDEMKRKIEEAPKKKEKPAHVVEKRKPGSLAVDKKEQERKRKRRRNRKSPNKRKPKIKKPKTSMLSKLPGGKIIDATGTAESVHIFLNAKTTSAKIQAGADLVADLAGYLGPVGAVGSAAYSITREVDSYLGISDTLARGMSALDRWLTGSPAPAPRKLTEAERKALIKKINNFINSVVQFVEGLFNDREELPKTGVYGLEEGITNGFLGVHATFEAEPTFWEQIQYDSSIDFGTHQLPGITIPLNQ